MIQQGEAEDDGKAWERCGSLFSIYSRCQAGYSEGIFGTHFSFRSLLVSSREQHRPVPMNLVSWMTQARSSQGELALASFSSMVVAMLVK
jgi:hypothetical protein